MKPFPVPVVPFGPGSQPAEDESLAYLAMPTSMHTFAMPSYAQIEAVGSAGEARRLLAAVLAGLDALQEGREGQTCFDLAPLAGEQRTLLNQVLGQGEVSAIAAGEPRLQYQETAFAGVWRGLHLAADGTALVDQIEVGGVPQAIEQAALRVPAGACVAAEAVSEGVVNAPGVLAELEARRALWRPGQPAHVVNLTLLPLSEADVACIAQALGTGPVTLLSRGYGNCRVASTALRNVWWVQYFNSQDALILNTLEVVGMPEAAIAAPEDLADSRERLGEVLQWVAEGSAT